MSNDVTDHNDGYDIPMHTNPDTGISWPDAMALMGLENALAAKRYRQAHGLDQEPPSPGLAEGVIDTGPFAKQCFITGTVWPPGSPNRVRMMAVHARDLPQDVKDRLRAEGCGPWVDEPNESIPIGAEMALGRPRTHISVAEIVALIRATPSPAERRQRSANR